MKDHSELYDLSQQLSSTHRTRWGKLLIPASFRMEWVKWWQLVKMKHIKVIENQDDFYSFPDKHSIFPYKVSYGILCLKAEPIEFMSLPAICCGVSHHLHKMTMAISYYYTHTYLHIIHFMIMIPMWQIHRSRKHPSFYQNFDMVSWYSILNGIDKNLSTHQRSPGLF